MERVYPARYWNMMQKLFTVQYDDEKFLFEYYT